MTVSWALSHREVTLLSTVSPSTVYCSQTKSDPTVSCLFLSQRQGAMFGRIICHWRRVWHGWCVPPPATNRI